METEKIKDCIDKIALTDDASERMYSNIQKKYESKKKSGVNPRIIIPVAACAALLAIGVSVTGIVLSKAKDGRTAETYGIVTTTVDPDGLAGEGNGFAGLNIPLSPVSDILFKNAVLTDEEGRAYLNENFGSIKSSLSASGVSVSDMKISEHGYYHIKCEQKTSADYEVTLDLTEYSVNQGFRDYLVYNGDTLVSIVTVTKDDDGRVGSSVSFGADDYYRSFDKFIKQNAGKEIIFLYVGNTEVILTNDYAPFSVGHNVSPLFENMRDPFNAFYSESVVYVA